MAAIVTKTPALIATAAMDRSNQNTQFVGATAMVQIGANLYAAVSGNAASFFAVYKSTDGGVTWVQKDAAHAPLLVATPLYEVIAAQDGIYFVWDGDGGAAASEQLGYACFSPATDTWGAVQLSPALMTVPGDRLAIARRSNGDIVTIFTSLSPVANDLQFGIWSKAAGGAWQGANNFFNTVSGASFGVAALAGPDDTIYVLSQDGVGPAGIYYQTIDPFNRVSPQLLIITLAGNVQPGLPVLWNNQLIFPYTDIGGGNPAMLVGSPVAAPAWSKILLTGVTPLANVSYPIGFVTGTNGLEIFVTLQGGGTFQLWLIPFPNGAFQAAGAPVLYYDGAANPPAAGAIDEILKVSVVLQSSGVLGMVGMQLTPGFPPENAYFLSPPCPSSA